MPLLLRFVEKMAFLLSREYNRNVLNDLEAGKVDLLGPLLKNEYTEEIYNFPEQDYGTVYTTLSVHWKPEICVRITLLLLCR